MKITMFNGLIKGLQKPRREEAELKSSLESSAKHKVRILKQKNFILGTKRLGSQNFPECEEKVARKKKCVGVNGSSNDEHLSAVTAVQHRRKP